MGDVPFKPPAARVAVHSSRSESPEPPPRRRVFAALLDLAIFAGVLFLAETLTRLGLAISVPEDAPIRNRDLLPWLIVMSCFYGPNLLFGFLRGATPGMTTLGLRLSTFPLSRARTVLMLVLRNPGFTAFPVFGVMALQTLYELNYSILIVYVFSISAAVLQLPAGLLMFTSSGLSLQDRLSKTRVVFADHQVGQPEK